MAITDDILAELRAGPLDDIAQQIGVEPAQAEAVIKDALPALLGGLEHNVSTDDGAASLASALGDHTEANPLGDLGSLLGGGIGGAILEHVLGGATPQVSDAIGGQSGVGSDKVQQILKIVAPIVLTYLAKNVLSGGKVDPSVVKEKVQKESASAKKQSQTPDLGSILGQILGGR